MQEKLKIDISIVQIIVNLMSKKNNKLKIMLFLIYYFFRRLNVKNLIFLNVSKYKKINIKMFFYIYLLVKYNFNFKIEKIFKILNILNLYFSSDQVINLINFFNLHSAKLMLIYLNLHKLYLNKAFINKDNQKFWQNLLLFFLMSSKINISKNYIKFLIKDNYNLKLSLLEKLINLKKRVKQQFIQLFVIINNCKIINSFKIIYNKLKWKENILNKNIINLSKKINYIERLIKRNILNMQNNELLIKKKVFFLIGKNKFFRKQNKNYKFVLKDFNFVKMNLLNQWNSFPKIIKKFFKFFKFFRIQYFKKIKIKIKKIKIKINKFKINFKKFNNNLLEKRVIMWVIIYYQNYFFFFLKYWILHWLISISNKNYIFLYNLVNINYENLNCYFFGKCFINFYFNLTKVKSFLFYNSIEKLNIKDHFLIIKEPTYRKNFMLLYKKKLQILWKNNFLFKNRLEITSKLNVF